MAYAEVDLTLLAEREGGRKHPLSLERKAYYRPHIVVGDATQREPVIRDYELVEEYLGVQFRPCPVTVYPGDSAQLILDLMYYPSLDYQKVKPGAEFTLREGGKIVGFGRIVNVFWQE